MAANLTHDDVVRLVETCLRDFGITLRLWAYRTHTGDPFKHPWTGPIAWEVSAASTHLTHDKLKALIAATEALGLRLHFGDADESTGALRFERLLSNDGEPPAR